MYSVCNVYVQCLMCARCYIQCVQGVWQCLCVMCMCVMYSVCNVYVQCLMCAMCYVQCVQCLCAMSNVCNVDVQSVFAMSNVCNVLCTVCAMCMCNA